MKRSVPVIISLIGLCLCMLFVDSTYPSGRQVKITDIESNSGLKYELDEELQIGDLQYTDRDYVFTEIPTKFIGLSWIRTANDDKNNANLQLSFTIDREANIYLFWVASGPRDRKWLVDQFFDTKELVQSSDEPLTIYESNKPFEKGEVTLEHVNAGNGMYVVVVEGTGKGLAVKPEGKLATRWSSLKRK